MSQKLHIDNTNKLRRSVESAHSSSSLQKKDNLSTRTADSTQVMLVVGSAHFQDVSISLDSSIAMNLPSSAV